MFQMAIIRPGLTEFDLQNRLQGALDLPLSSEGEQDIEQILELLKSTVIEILYSSPGEPARSTARKIAARLGIPVKDLDGLRNGNLGLWQGLTIDEVKRKYPTVYKQWKDSPDTVCPPGGEDSAQLTDRALKALAKPLKRGISFGVVVGEPLATLLSCTLRQTPRELPAAFCCKSRPELVERLEVSHPHGSFLATPVSSS